MASHGTPLAPSTPAHPEPRSLQILPLLAEPLILLFMFDEHSLFRYTYPNAREIYQSWVASAGPREQSLGIGIAEQAYARRT